MPTALITGASASIGRALALRFAAGGYDLIVTARRPAELGTLAAEVTRRGRACHTFTADLSDPAAVPRLWQSVAAAGLTVDALAANAGFGQYGPFAEADPDRLLAMLQVNMLALAHLTRLALPGMIERGHGRILTVASIAGYLPGPRMAGYYASKAFVRSLSEALSHEVRGTGVTVTCLCPGPVRTEFARAAVMTESALFDGPGVMTAEAVADAGYRGLMAGRRTVVPGWRNKLGVFATRFVPTALLLRAVDVVQRRKQSTGERRASAP